MLTVEHAFTGQTVAELAQTSWSDLDGALARADKIHYSRSERLPAWKRIEILENAAAQIVSRRDELAQQIAIEGGKPLIDALVEVDRAAHSTKAAAQVLSSDEGREIPMDLTQAGDGRLAFTQRVPIGPVVAVSAFNHPLNLIAHQVAPAIAADCPVIVKPAGPTPLSCLTYAEIMYQAGLPEDRLVVALTRRADSEKLVCDPRVSFFSFIGSGQVGWYLRSKLAPGTRCALEHGGVAPVVLAEDADLDLAIEGVAKGGFYHAGQVCVSVQRVFAVGEASDRFIDGLTEKASRLQVGDPTLLGSEVGPLISPSEVDRVESWVNEALAQGAKITCGGERLSDRVYAPTVLVNPPSDSKVAQHEIFGPVVSVFKCETLDEAVQRANAVDASFQAAVYSRSINTALDVADHLNGSAVMVNDHTAFRVDWMPFAGLGTSGLGVGGIPSTYHDMTVEQMTVVRRGASSVFGLIQN